MTVLASAVGLPGAQPPSSCSFVRPLMAGGTKSVDSF